MISDDDREAFAATITAETFNSLTLGEAMEFEEASGVTLDSFAGQRPPLKAIVALIWILGRRNHPDFTFEDAKGISFRQIAFVRDAMVNGQAVPN